MTTEVVVMNKNAISLAADSVATLEGGTETYSQHRKLFALSHYQPIGIMIYNRLQLNGIPWETIIKLYRRHLGQKHFPTTKDYLDDFLTFIQNQHSLFSDPKRHLHQDICCALQILEKKVLTLWHECQNTDSSFANMGLNEFTQLYVTNKIEELSKRDALLPFKQETIRKIVQEAYPTDPQNLFQVFNLTEGNVAQLKELCTEMIYRDSFRLSSTGIVISGFGEDEIFPSVSNALVGGFYNEKLKVRKEETQKISHDNQAQIIPFAQTDMISAFIKGIHPDYESHILNSVFHAFGDFSEKLIEQILPASGADQEHHQQEAQKLVIQYFENIRQDISYHIMKEHIQPVIDTVKHLPKESLTSVAESLVQMTSFKKTVLSKDRSVGGEINVALITKGDGLIHVKQPQSIKEIEEQILLPLDPFSKQPSEKH